MFPSFKAHVGGYSCPFGIGNCQVFLGVYFGNCYHRRFREIGYWCLAGKYISCNNKLIALDLANR